MKSKQQTFTRPIWMCVPKHHDPERPNRVIYVETERWFDARAFAIRTIGCVDADVVMASETPTKFLFPRYQLTWFGTAASGTTNPLRQMARYLMSSRSAAKVAWRAVG